MRNRIILVFVFAFVTAFTAMGQGAKIGYADPNYILSLMPEAKSIESELQAYEKQLQTQLESKYKEFQDKYQAYEKGKNTMAQVVREDKEKELANTKTRIILFLILN